MGFFQKVKPSYLGLMFVHMWIYCTTHQGAAIEGAPVMTWLYTAQAVFLGAVVLFSLRRELDSDMRHMVDLIAAACMMAAVLLVSLPVGGDRTVELILGSCLGGIGVSWAYIRWAQLYARFEASFSAPLVFLTMALGSVGKAAVDLLPPAVEVVVLMLLPAAAFGSCLLAKRGAPTAAPAIILFNHRTVSSLWRVALGVAVYSLAVGIVQSVMLDGIPATQPALILLHHGAEMVLGIGLFLWVLPMGGGLSFSRTWRLIVLLMTTALVFLPYIDESLLGYLLSLVRTAQTLLIILLFLALADLARHSSYRVATVFAAGWAAYALPFALGTAVGNLVRGATADTMVAAAIVWATVLAAIYFLDENAVGRSLVFSDLKKEDLDEESDVERISAAQEFMGTWGEDVIERRCKALAKEADLTSRETEILELLARGRSKAYIADAFIISENTVRTHVKHLYAKLDVHTRQELLDRVESAELPPTP